MRTLYTIGYGNNSSNQLLERLIDAGVTIVYDIRRKGTKTWNFWFAPGANIAGLLARGGIKYVHKPYFANINSDVQEYADWLRAEQMDAVAAFAAEIVASDLTPCLLCSELIPVTSANVALCHRVPLADTIAEVANVAIVHL